MKFLEAVKLLQADNNKSMYRDDGFVVCIKDGYLISHALGNRLPHIGGMDETNWVVKDRPRPVVSFKEAMEAAVKGKQIKSLETEECYHFSSGMLVSPPKNRDVVNICAEENRGKWEILD